MDVQQDPLELLPSPEARKVFEVVRRHSGERLTYKEIENESGVSHRTVQRTCGKGGYLERLAPKLGVIPLRFRDEGGRFECLGWHVFTVDQEVEPLVETPDEQAVSLEVEPPDGMSDSGGGIPRARSTLDPSLRSREIGTEYGGMDELPGSQVARQEVHDQTSIASIWSTSAELAKARWEAECAAFARQQVEDAWLAGVAHLLLAQRGIFLRRESSEHLAGVPEEVPWD